jgi:hypothetical protein
MQLRFKPLSEVFYLWYSVPKEMWNRPTNHPLRWNWLWFEYLARYCIEDWMLLFDIENWDRNQTFSYQIYSLGEEDRSLLTLYLCGISRSYNCYKTKYCIPKIPSLEIKWEVIVLIGIFLLV